MELEPGAPVPSRGASIRLDGKAIGVVTSAVLPAGAPRPVALGYVKTREIPEGTTTLVVEDGEVSGSATLIRG
jgi:glycine cleavage system aminomethyltransferase T